MTEQTDSIVWIGIVMATVAGLLILVIEGIVLRGRRRTGKPTTAGGHTAGGEPSAFERLRTNHARRGEAIDATEVQLRKTLGGDRGPVIEAERIAAQTGQPLEAVQQLLKELVSSGALRRLYLWQCPRGLGTTAEAERLTSLPTQTECERCGEIHSTDADDIDEVLIASDSLQRELDDGGVPVGSPSTRTSAASPTR